MQRDSYDSGDWYNRVDYSLQDNNWDKGLPRQDKDGGNYALIQKVIDTDGTNAKPGNAEIANMVSYYRELAALRAHYPLLTLGKGEEVIKRVSFLNTGRAVPGLIVMAIDNGTASGADIDPALDGLVVAINATNDAIPFNTHVSGLTVSPEQTTNLKGSAGVSGTTITLPAWSPVVFELPRTTVRGNGIPVTSN